MGASTILSEADLHGLVDGFLDPARRAEVLRRAAASPRDRALVETWQDQNDAIRLAFAHVESEPLPMELDLRLVGAIEADPTPETGDARTRRKLAATLFIGLSAGLVAAWTIAGLDLSRVAALALPSTVRVADTALATLPTTTIPDLSAAGLAFAGAGPRSEGSDGLVFRYSRGTTEKVSIDTVRAGIEKSPISAEPGGFVWTDRGVTYRISGTVSPDRLRALAIMVQGQLSKG